MACGDMIEQYKVQQNQFLVIFSSFTLFCCDLFDFFLCFQYGSVFSSLLSVCLSTEEVSVTCVSFSCVVYFCLFSPLKDRYISSFWRLRPQTPTGALPLDPAGGLPSTRPPVLPPFSKFLAMPLSNQHGFLQ